MRIIASHNGLAAVEKGWEILQAGGTAMDAVVAGVTLVEDDPNEHTVGYGGLPNENGIVELDAAVMDGRTLQAGSVSALRDVRHAAKLARLVMEQTTRVMLAGEGARDFAIAQGFPLENLLTEQARKMWMYWRRRRSHCDDWLATDEDDELDLAKWYGKNFYKSETSPTNPAAEVADTKPGGTIHCSAIDKDGNLACVTTTSGHAFKLAGRLGDSPVIGAGLYADNSVGTCGSIGHGEANLRHCGSFAVLELMRAGQTPIESAHAIFRRIIAAATDREMNAEHNPEFNLQYFILDKDGNHFGASLWDNKKIAVADDQGCRLEPCIPLLTSKS